MAPVNKKTIDTTTTSKTNQNKASSPITTKMGSLRYKQAAHQVRSIEQENVAATAKCYPGLAIMRQSRQQQKPNVIEIKLELPTPSTGQKCAADKKSRSSRKCLCEEKAQKTSGLSSTISKTDSRESVLEKRRPWHKVRCTQLQVVTSTATDTIQTIAGSARSKCSDYQDWVNTVPLCLKSESSESTESLKVKKQKFEPRESRKHIKDFKKKVDPTLLERISSKKTDNAATISVGRQRLTGAAWKRPCPASVIAGAPQRYTGTCPPTIEQIAKMSDARKKFFLTQDPRRIHCLVNPDFLRTKKVSPALEFKAFSNIVKRGENICKAKRDTTMPEPIVCETIDLDNPLSLDFHGLDYKNTYQNDEQNFQNQRHYKRLARHMDRKRAKVETKETAEAELQAERLAIPARFDLETVAEEEQIIMEPGSDEEEEIKLGKLYRSVEKPMNKKRIEAENKSRRERYKNLYLQFRERELEHEKEKEAAEQVAEEMLGATVALQTIERANERVNDAIMLSVKGTNLVKPPEAQRHRYPHTIRETRAYKQKLTKEKRLKHDKALVKQQFYEERLGKHKDYPELHVEVGKDQEECKIEVIERSSESSDDEDALEVGKVGSNFMLRGFHFKLGSNLRGKTHQREKFTGLRKEKGCIRREDWLDELAPQKHQFKLDVAVGIVKDQNPDHPDYELFPAVRDHFVPKTKSSAVQEYVAQRLGRHYKRLMSRKLKIRMPRLPYHVKKFNLIKFLYSENDRRLEAMRTEEIGKDYAALPTLSSTLDYIAENDLRRKDEKELTKRKRMKALGIPCIEPKVKVSQVKCEASDTDTDSDWVPEPEPNVEGNLAEYEERMQAGQIAEKLPIEMMGNMPAPEFREPTLRRHPRHTRDYPKLRVPSAEFYGVVQTSGLPHMLKLDPEQRFYENVKLPKRAYTEIFQARHHHDHSNPVESSVVDVHYQPKVIHAEVTKEPLNLTEEEALKATFEKAFPECMHYVNQDLTTVQYDIEAMLAEYRNECKKTVSEAVTELVKDLCQQKEFRFHSRDPRELLDLEYPGRQEYLNFLNEIRATLEEQKRAIDEENEDFLCLNRKQYLEELEEDLKSIESCLTSVSSSICTNLTNDSGSFLLMGGVTKVPMDYIRKSVVPFEELQRSRFKAVPIDTEVEEANPFHVLPFSGQKQVQLSKSKPKDKFFTSSSRQRNDVRLRLETPLVDVRKTLIGRGARKFSGAVATDIDENYITELKKTPWVKPFPFKSGRDYLKNAQRLKLESKVIQGQIVRTKIYDRLNEQHWKAMQMTKELYEKLFLKWAKREYDAAMTVVHKVTDFYDITDDLRTEYYDLDHQRNQLNLNIVFVEGTWLRRVMLQNFHYLLASMEWRKEHDWIHRIQVGEDENGEPIYGFEPYDVSIANRSKVNVRNREKDDAVAIKEYYENVYLPNRHPIEIVFPDAESFLRGFDALKRKTFNMLLEMHFTTSVHNELEGKMEEFEELCVQTLKPKEEYVNRKCAKRYFMERRVEELKKLVMDYLDAPLQKAISDPVFNRDRAIVAEVWRQIVPATQRGASNQETRPVDQMAMISEVILNLLALFEPLSTAASRKIEDRLRRHRAYMRKVSKAAYQNECRINLEMKKVIDNLKAEPKKPKPPKPKRSNLKKVEKPVIVPEMHISEHTKFFFRAFHEEGDVMSLFDARDSMLDLGTMQDQMMTFHFDHFLKLNGYVPNYNFKTRVELRDGPEIERFQVKKLIPEVLEKLEKWESQRKDAIEDSIQQNPHLYRDIKI